MVALSMDDEELDEDEDIAALSGMFHVVNKIVDAGMEWEAIESSVDGFRVMLSLINADWGAE